jgi:hypothetical protein
MPDDSHHGEGEHDQRDVTMPAMGGAGFVVIETEFVLAVSKLSSMPSDDLRGGYRANLIATITSLTDGSDS